MGWVSTIGGGRFNFWSANVIQVAHTSNEIVGARSATKSGRWIPNSS